MILNGGFLSYLLNSHLSLGIGLLNFLKVSHQSIVIFLQRGLQLKNRPIPKKNALFQTKEKQKVNILLIILVTKHLYSLFIYLNTYIS